MKFSPLRKVGDPVSFKGLRGPYLMTAIIRLAILIACLFIVGVISLDNITKSVIVIGLVVVYWFKLEPLKKLSRGDLYLTLKKNCRKPIKIRK